MSTDELVQRLREYAAIENHAADKAQAESLKRAADIMALYESMSWVPEMDEQHPVGRRNFGRGRPHDPQSFSRFCRWLAGVRGVALHGARLAQLKDAEELRRTYFHQVEISPSTEREIRPFKQLAKQGYGDKIPELWAKATVDGPATSATVRAAIAEFRKSWTRTERRSATVAEKLSQRRSRALGALEDLWALDPAQAVEIVNLWAGRHGLQDQDAAA